ncbi:DUF4831 family protein [Bacteroidales bacterium OttesenSCG-928-B11]|nr:DUF4831 family protein [Bacteroidales bacterium OttesenSCG-928-C03]MDL2312788.1 DUF4831 family protein [Bacteroidales bacterium OttesenSCG-928-B11]MDL2325872.1 DUF4831 family protein [Bacteroidales bacterium OttesenSCG-928-A14]
MKKILPLLILIFSIVATATAQQKVVPVAFPVEYSAATSSDVFYYMLPQTAFLVTVKIQKTKEFQGYYADYAEKLLGLNNIITQNKITYKLKGVTIDPVNIPDTSQFYSVELSATQKKKGLLDQLYAGNSTADHNVFNPTYEITTASIPDFFRNYADLAYSEMDDSFVETKIINGVVTQVPVNQTKLVSKSAGQKAQEAADFIIKVRKDRYDLLTGINEVAYSGDAIQYMIEQLNQAEQNYIQLFTGFTVTNEETYTFLFIPDGSEASFLFSIDPETGLKRNAPGKNGQNYYLETKPLIDNLKHSYFETAKYTVTKLKPHDGYRIRKALPAMVTLKKDNQPVNIFGTYYIYQLGRIDILPLKSDNFNILEYGILY